MLTMVTTHNTTIDDVQVRSSTDTPASTVIIHFVDHNEMPILTTANALRSLDSPTNGEQKWAKQQLLSIHRLRTAGGLNVLQVTNIS